MYRVETYAGLLEGIPRRGMNIDILRRVGSKGMSLFSSPTFRTTPIVLPTRMQPWPKKEWVPWVMPSEPDTLPRDAPEVLPGFLTVARFISSPLRDDVESTGNFWRKVGVTDPNNLTTSGVMLRWQ